MFGASSADIASTSTPVRAHAVMVLSPPGASAGKRVAIQENLPEEHPHHVPCWFVPFFAGIYLLFTQYSRDLLSLFAAFVIVGFGPDSGDFQIRRVQRLRSQKTVPLDDI